MRVISNSLQPRAQVSAGLGCLSLLWEPLFSPLPQGLPPLSMGLAPVPSPVSRLHVPGSDLAMEETKGAWVPLLVSAGSWAFSGSSTWGDSTLGLGNTSLPSTPQ